MVSHRIFLLIFLASVGATAAPTPMSSSSRAISPYWGLFVSPIGFAVDSRKTVWKVSEIPEGSENAQFALRTASALLTVRIDENKNARNPQSYMNSWTALYSRLGFEILGNRPFTQNGETAYVLDMIRKDKNAQARQAVFFRDNKAIIVNCQDSVEAFRTSLSECNKIIRSFRWIDPNILVPNF